MPADMSTLPPPRAAHSAVAVGRKLFVFGGQSQSAALDDLHIFDSDTCEWTLGRRAGDMPGAHLRLVLALSLFRLPFCDWFAR
eukprot:1191912-Prorocentrum_minimum.AAC.1